MLADPALSNNGDDDTGTCANSALVATDSSSAAALIAQPGFTRASCGYKDTSDGWTDLSAHRRMAWDYASAPDGNVVQTGRTELTGLRGHRQLTLALGFGATAAGATATARGSLAAGFGGLATRYAAGWHAYLASLKRPPRGLVTAAERREYAVSAMVLAASEDKTYRGAYVASPTMPWAWGTGLQNPTGRTTWSGRATCTRSPPR